MTKKQKTITGFIILIMVLILGVLATYSRYLKYNATLGSDNIELQEKWQALDNEMQRLALTTITLEGKYNNKVDESKPKKAKASDLSMTYKEAKTNDKKYETALLLDNELSKIIEDMLSEKMIEVNEYNSYRELLSEYKENIERMKDEYNVSFDKYSKNTSALPVKIFGSKIDPGVRL